MRYMSLPAEQREVLLASLEDMPRYLGDCVRALTPELTCRRAEDDSFSPLEQVWHLADLEREGFGFRIERLLTETEPQLPDFDGTAIAAARNYRALALEEGLEAFRVARARNLAKFRSLENTDWNRGGNQEGVGRVTLCDLPIFMAQHDASHREELESWKRQMLT